MQMGILVCSYKLVAEGEKNSKFQREINNVQMFH